MTVRVTVTDSDSDCDCDSDSTRKRRTYAGSGCGSELKLHVDFGIHLCREGQMQYCRTQHASRRLETNYCKYNNVSSESVNM